MHKISKFIAVVFIWIFAGSLTVAIAQQSSGDSKNVPRISLGESSGAPGETAVVPIYFASPDGLEVGHIKFEVIFVSKNLKFASLKRGMAAESGNVELKTEAKEGKNDKGLETTTLIVDASVPTANAGKKGIPAGLLGFLNIQIGEKAGPANVMLRITGEAFELGTGKSIPTFKTIEAQFDVIASGSEPLYSCFFFSH